MTANELRIGNLVRLTTKKNWIYGDRDGKLPEGVHSVKSISNRGINYAEFENVYWNELDNYEGIPLTPEWLERFGFTKRSNIDDEIECIYECELGYCISIGANANYWKFHYPSLYAGDIEVSYLHQLQNLYFSLTYKELTLDK